MGGKQQKAFEDLKEFLMKLTMLSPPKEGAHLLLYVATAPAAVSTVLVQEIEEKDQKKQQPIFYMSLKHSLQPRSTTMR